jgi:NitT/TauT family transport system substrate-binding protein
MALLGGCGRSSEPKAAPGDSAAAPGPPLEKIRFDLDWYPVAEHGGYFEALVKGYYRDAGLDVTIVSGGPGPPGPNPVAAVGTGHAEMAMGACDDAILAIRQGLPLLIVGAQMEHDPQAVMVHADDPVKSFPDLNGRSVMAVPAAHWVAYVQAHYKIQFNTIPMDYGMGQFFANKTFIQQCFISSEPYYAEMQGVKTRTLLVATGGYDPYRVLFTNRTFAAGHPQAVRAFLAASVRGWHEYLHGDAAAARARIQGENPAQTTPLMDYTIDTLKRYQLVEGDPAKGERAGLITPERMKTLVDTLVELKLLDGPLPLDQFVSFDFLPADPGPAAR